MILWPASDKAQKKNGSRKMSTTLADRAALTAAILASTQVKRQRQCIIVTGETCHYRAAARSVPTSDDNWGCNEDGGPLKALEIGSAHG